MGMTSLGSALTKAASSRLKCGTSLTGGNALLAHTVYRQIFEEITHETSEKCAKSTRF